MVTNKFEIVITGTPDPRQFTVFLPGENGTRLAEYTFDWRVDSTALNLDLGEMAALAISGKPPEDDLHQRFGKSLYRAIFAGRVGEFWKERRKQSQRTPLRLVVRVDSHSARHFLNIPWEYLHDGEDFIATNWHTPLSRLPWGLEVESDEPLKEPLRLLVVIAAPNDLSENERLHTAREEDLILAATSDVRKTGLIQIEFAADGSLQTLGRYLRDFDPHILHFTGHGVFDQLQDVGWLLMETSAGRREKVLNSKFADLIRRRGRALRMVFLSACQSAIAPRTEGFADLGTLLLGAGIPAVVAMQYSVLNRSAMELSGVYYKGIIEGDPVDEAMVVARGQLRQTSPNQVDFAVPVLFLADPDCLKVDPAALRERAEDIPLDLSGVTPAQNFVGRSAYLRELQTNLDPRVGRWRAAVIYGMGGMGKTVLAARLAQRMASRFDGVKALRMSPTTTAQNVLDQVGAFLMVNNARFNHHRISDFNQTKDAQIPLEAKAGLLGEILGNLALLLIFDNYEDVLAGGQVVSVGAQKTESTLDPDLAKLVSTLVGSVSDPSRFVFTSRVDFDPVERGRLTGAIGHLDLGEMGFRDAVYLMETLPPLAELPVAVIEDSPLQRAKGQKKPAGKVKAISMRDVHERLGGHPYTLNLFAEHAGRSSVGEVLKDLRDVKQELLEFTLLERAVEQLPDGAEELLRKSAIFDEPVPMEGLAYIVGDERDSMPRIDAEVEALLGWGLLAQPPGEGTYLVHSLVKDWAREQLDPQVGQRLLLRAANFWLGVGEDSRRLEPKLIAHHYLFLAGQYEQADEIVQIAFTYLLRWGQIELLIHLLKGSVDTLEGKSRAIALGNLATVYQDLGDYTTARKFHQQVLKEFESHGDQRNVGTTLQRLGMLHRAQGEYPRARKRYEQSLAIAQELGDRAGVASSLHELGVLHQHQGEYPQARERYEQSLAIAQELGDQAGIGLSQWGLGILHHDQGEYSQARQLYERALKSFQRLGDRKKLAGCLHQLAILHQHQGEYRQSRERYEQSLAIERELGHRVGVASSLYQLGVLHQHQGEYPQARERYEQSLAIAQELGDQAGIGLNQWGLGILHYRQGEYSQARQLYERALKSFQRLGDRKKMAGCLHQLAILHQHQGEYRQARERYQQSLSVAYELGDQVGVAASLGQLGSLFEEEGDFRQAVKLTAKAFYLFDQLGSPNKEIVGRTLARLRDKLGEQAFKAALPEVREFEVESAEDGMSLEQALEVIVSKTVAVMTEERDQREEWWQALGQLISQVKAQGLDEMVRFLSLVRQLVEGASPKRLSPQVPEDFLNPWQEILNALSDSDQ